MNTRLKLPIGYENFEELRSNSFYYVDKTKLIEELLENKAKVNLITCPRRFGKTLNMSMLKYFFDVDTNPSLFNDLYISSNYELCSEYLGKYPIIFISLKGVEGLSFLEAKDRLVDVITYEAKRFSFLLDSD